jgi:hypothetical protein
MTPLKQGTTTSSFRATLTGIILNAVTGVAALVQPHLVGSRFALTPLEQSVIVGAAGTGITALAGFYARNRTRLEGIWHQAEADVEKVIGVPATTTLEQVVRDAVSSEVAKVVAGTSTTPAADPGAGSPPADPSTSTSTTATADAAPDPGTAAAAGAPTAAPVELAPTT